MPNGKATQVARNRRSLAKKRARLALISAPTLWKKGQSGNPRGGGTPAPFQISRALRWLLGLAPTSVQGLIHAKELREYFPQIPPRPTYGELLGGFILKNAIEHAAAGEFTDFIQCVLDRVEGRAPLIVRDERESENKTPIILTDTQINTFHTFLTSIAVNLKDSKEPTRIDNSKVIDMEQPLLTAREKEKG